jgi:ubiquinone/menaquinone biosynthesis C-methylase UbiE
MKEWVLDILACPVCKEYPLGLDQLGIGSDIRKNCEIERGRLTCKSCRREYPIDEGIPNMIPTTQETGKDAQVRQANMKYHDLRADVYDQEEENWFVTDEFVQAKVEAIVRHLSDGLTAESSWFLDVGCGTGNLMRSGRKYFERAVGVDVSRNMLQMVRGKGCEVIQAGALQLPFRPDTFSVVSIFSVLHHLYDYLSFFGEANRVLKSGGFLYTDWDPNRRPPIDKNRLSWRTFRLMKLLASPMRKLHGRLAACGRGNLRELDPTVRELGEMSECHNLGVKEEERGIDVERVKEVLAQRHFKAVEPAFHWAGRSIRELPLSARARFFFLRFQDYPPERYMENVRIIAQKG